jgi:hypothetical protein
MHPPPPPDASRTAQHRDPQPPTSTRPNTFSHLSHPQLHYPFENKALFEANFPADFIAEGLDQTRGWCAELHAAWQQG